MARRAMDGESLSLCCGTRGRNENHGQLSRILATDRRSSHLAELYSCRSGSRKRVQCVEQWQSAGARNDSAIYKIARRTDGLHAWDLRNQDECVRQDEERASPHDAGETACFVRHDVLAASNGCRSSRKLREIS